jgi:DNA (cytosine-5)-methyltransferase 3A
MKAVDRDIISKAMGCSPMRINSRLVTAQNRERLFWHNTGVFMQPMDQGIVLADIVEDGVVDREKSYCVAATYHEIGVNSRRDYDKACRQVVFKTGIQTVPRGYNNGGIKITDKSPPVTSSAFEHNNKLVINPIKLGHLGQDKRPYRVYSTEGKSVTLMGNAGGMGAKTGLYYTHEGIRKLTPLECERLQGIPEGYTDKGVSNTQRYKMIGNGFTIPVIMHILNGITGA